MGFLSKLKEKLFKKNKTVKEQEVQDKYVSGLDKSRKNFVDKLAQLKARYNKIDDEYFEELENITFMEAYDASAYLYHFIRIQLE